VEFKSAESAQAACKEPYQLIAGKKVVPRIFKPKEREYTKCVALVDESVPLFSKKKEEFPVYNLFGKNSSLPKGIPMKSMRTEAKSLVSDSLKQLLFELRNDKPSKCAVELDTNLRFNQATIKGNEKLRFL